MPRIDVSPARLDLGLVMSESQDLIRRVRVRNLGTRDLDVTGFESSCGCTIAEWSPSRIQPGAAEDVSITVRPKHTTGDHSSRVSIFSNDPATPVVTVDVRWSEQNALSFEPVALDLGRQGVGGHARRTVEVRLLRDFPDGDLVLSASPNVVAGWSEAPAPDRANDRRNGSTRRLRLDVDAGEVLGDQTAEVFVASKDGLYRARLPVAWKVGPEVEVLPRAVFRSGVGRAEGVAHRVVVSAVEATDVRVSSLTVDDAPVPYQLDRGPDSPDGSVAVSFVVRAGTRAGLERHTARIVVRGATAAEVTLPITYLVK